MLVAVAAVLAIACPAAADALLDAAAAGDPAAIAEVERAPDADPTTVFAAAHAAEAALHDPARALALYERVLRVAPDARIAVAAGKRAAELRLVVGAGDGREAAALADTIAHADTREPAEVGRALERLTAAAWPGAPDAALFHADWLRRAGRFADAAARYDALIARWPDLPQAHAARRARAGVALDRRDFHEAELLAEVLPATDALDALERDDLIVQARRGQQRDRLYVFAWIALIGALGAMVGSLAVAARRAKRRPRLPAELIFLGPVALVLIGVAFTAHRVIAPAVATIAGGGLVFASLSGATLDLMRAAGRPIRLRAVSHIATCALAVACLVYIAMMRDGLLDMLLETVRFGPDG